MNEWLVYDEGDYIGPCWVFAVTPGGGFWTQLAYRQDPTGKDYRPLGIQKDKTLVIYNDVVAYIPLPCPDYPEAVSLKAVKRVLELAGEVDND